MLHENISIKHTIDLLNSALISDRNAVEKLVGQRVKCNKTMAEHPTIQVGTVENQKNKYEVGLLGILNGLFGVDEKGYGPISAVFDDDKLIKFVRTKHKE